MSAIGSNTKQKGVALIVFVVMISLALTLYMFKANNPASLKAEQNKKTELALAIAKQSLLAYATEEMTATPRVPPLLRCIDRNTNGIIDVSDAPYEPENCNCGLNCIRPGDLPCPDLNNDGEAETACSNQADRLGRLPWKTLGIGDVRDGAGERLWYAVSTRYKNNPRVLPLNNQTLATISLKNSIGFPINTASTATGLSAVIISPGQALTRSDGVVQNRTSANQNIAIHYLDIALGEDNADFSDVDANNGFIAGPIKVMQINQMVTINNDIVLPVTRNEINALMELRVLAEAMQAINYFFSVKGFYPGPANLADTTCLDPIVNDASHASCAIDTAVTFGRLPVGDSATAPSNDIWAGVNANSILRGESSHNWFQQNGWRTLVQLQKNLSCAAGEKRCRLIDSQTTIRITN